MSDEVRTGSGSDRVSMYAMVEPARTMTRSLPLSVLTSLLLWAHMRKHDHIAN